MVDGARDLDHLLFRDRELSHERVRIDIDPQPPERLPGSAPQRQPIPFKELFMFTSTNALRIGPHAPRLLTVQAPEDIEYLVKESEVLTGQAGRTFVISGADWLVYRVSFCERTHPSGLKVERLDAHGRVVSTQHLQVWEFLEHSLVEAQAAGLRGRDWELEQHRMADEAVNQDDIGTRLLAAFERGQ